MEGFKLIPKPNTPNTFLVTYNDKVVERQQNDLNWVPFETTDAYFNDSKFWVVNNSDQSVEAKFLTRNGDVVLNSKGNPYIVPADFNFEQFIEKYQNAGKVDLIACRQGGKDDFQRSYNGIIDGPFCASFTAAASFVYGVASREAGLTVDDSLYYGGVYNIMAGKKTGGELGNGVHNPPNIRDGYKFMDKIKSEVQDNSTQQSTLQGGSGTDLLHQKDIIDKVAQVDSSKIDEIKNTEIAIDKLSRNPHSKDLLNAYAKAEIEKNGQTWTADSNKNIAENMLQNGVRPQRVEEALKHSPQQVDNAYYFVKDIRNSPEIQQVQQSKSIGRSM